MESEVKLALCIVKHGAPFKMTDSLTATIRRESSDSQVTKLYASGGKKTTCILNKALRLYLKKKILWNVFFDILIKLAFLYVPLLTIKMKLLAKQ